MGKLKGFIEYERTDEGLIPVKKRVKNYKEFTLKPSEQLKNLLKAMDNEEKKVHDSTQSSRIAKICSFSNL